MSGTKAEAKDGEMSQISSPLHFPHPLVDSEALACVVSVFGSSHDAYFC